MRTLEEILIKMGYDKKEALSICEDVDYSDETKFDPITTIVVAAYENAESDDDFYNEIQNAIEFLNKAIN
jgi:hypothetical protein